MSKKQKVSPKITANDVERARKVADQKLIDLFNRGERASAKDLKDCSPTLRSVYLKGASAMRNYLWNLGS